MKQSAHVDYSGKMKQKFVRVFGRKSTFEVKRWIIPFFYQNNNFCSNTILNVQCTPYRRIYHIARYIIFFAFLRKIAHLQIPIADGSRVTLHPVSLLQPFFILYLERNAITRLISERARERASEREVFSVRSVLYSSGT